MKLTLNTRNAYGNGTSQWTATAANGDRIGSVLRGNYPFAEYRLIMNDRETRKFTSQAALIAYLENI